MKNTLKFLGYYTLFLVLLSFILSLLNLLGVNSTITNLLIFIFNIITFFIFGLKNGHKAQQKGYIAGLKIGLLFLFVLILLNIFINSFVLNLATIIYYIILLSTSILGGMIGINKKEDSK